MGRLPVSNTSARDRLRSGIILTILAGTCFATMDGIAKLLSNGLPVVMLVWGRYLFHTAFVAAYLLWSGGPGFWRTRRPGAHLVRSIVVLAAGLLMYAALTQVSLADATTALFLAPILVAASSALFLGERIGPHRVAAILGGFVGVILILRPGSSQWSIYLLLPVLAAVLQTVYLFLTQSLAVAEERRAAQFNTTSIGLVILSALVIPVWQTPSLLELTALAAMGLLGATGHVFLVVAFRHASASRLSPFLYAQVLAAWLISLFWFNDALEPVSLVGSALLVGSGIYIWWRERRASRTGGEEGR